MSMQIILSKMAKSEVLYGRAKALARKRGCAVSEIVRRALEQYLSYSEPQQTRLEENQKKRLARALNKNADEFSDGDVT